MPLSVIAGICICPDMTFLFVGRREGGTGAHLISLFICLPVNKLIY